MNTIDDYKMKHKALFWSVMDPSKVSDKLLVETILNYGTREDVKDLFKVMGIEKVANIFFEATIKSKRHNYLPQVANFFRHYFKKHGYNHLNA